MPAGDCGYVSYNSSTAVAESLVCVRLVLNFRAKYQNINQRH